MIRYPVDVIEPVLYSEDEKQNHPFKNGNASVIELRQDVRQCFVALIVAGYRCICDVPSSGKVPD